MIIILRILPNGKVENSSLWALRLPYLHPVYMSESVEQFLGLLFTAAADRTDFSGLLELLPGTRSVSESVFNVLIGDAQTVADFYSRFLELTRPALLRLLIVYRGPEGLVPQN